MAMPAIPDADFAWPLWDDAPLAGAFVFGEEAGAAVVTAVDRPWLFGFAGPAPVGRAMLVLAGGGYTRLMVEREGAAVARWLAGLGLHAFVLVHRLPDAACGPRAPLDDARRALRLIADRGLAPAGIGVVGLSSGGHLAAALLADYPAAWAVDDPLAAAPPPRLDVAVIGYGPISTNAAGRAVVADKPPLDPPAKQALYDTVQPDVQLAPAPPPCFVVYAANDPVVPVENAWRLAAALHAAGGAVELHAFADAPHGFAMDTQGLPVSRWPELCTAWLRQTGFLPD